MLVHLPNLNNDISVYNPKYVNLLKYLSTFLKTMYNFKIYLYNTKHKRIITIRLYQENSQNNLGLELFHDFTMRIKKECLQQFN